MKHIHLAFKAYDVHELLCHAMAEATGLYTDAGLAVTLIDSTFVPDEALPENTFHAGLRRRPGQLSGRTTAQSRVCRL